jgi:membrane associated rhomboid family serine protease
MKGARSGGVVVDVCPSCLGIWFDADEFLPVARVLAEKMGSAGDLTQLFKPRQVHGAGSDTRRLCPRCTVSLHNFNYAYDSNILLDKCPQCGGVWTDRGEIKQVAAHLKGDPRVEEIGRDLLKHQAYMERIAKKPQPMSPLMFYLPHALPFGDDLERRRFPFLTLGIILLSSAVFTMTMYFSNDLGALFKTWGHTPAQFFSMTLFTSMFLHAGVVHLLGNMYFLWLFGDNIEDRLGRVWFIPFYLAAGLAADVAQTLADVNSSIPSVGASGAISGVMGAYIVFYPMANIKLFCWGRIVEVAAVLYLGIWFAFQVGSGLLLGAGGLSNVAWFAHIGGFAFGAAAAFVVKTRCPDPDA